MAACRGRYLVEDGEGVAHGAVGLAGDYSECLSVGLDALLLCHICEMVNGVVDCDALEVVDLAAAQDGGDDLMLLGRGENEYHIRRRFLKRLEESVECL